MARGIVTLVAVPLVLYSAWTHRSELARGLGLLPRLSPGWLLAGVVAEIGSLAAYSQLQRRLLGPQRSNLTRRHSFRLMLAANAMSNSLPGGSAWASTWYWSELRRRSIQGSRAAWAIVAGGVLNGVALAVLIAAGALIAGDRGPLASLRWAGAAVGILAASILGVVTMGPTFRSASGPARIPSRIQEWVQYGRDLRGAKVALPFSLSIANWGLDLFLLAMCIRSVDRQLPLHGLMAAYGLTQLSLLLPITPGGLAIVEGTLAALLTTYGIRPATAIAAVLLYRAVTFWFLTPAGWIAFIALRKSPSTSAEGVTFVTG